MAVFATIRRRRHSASVLSVALLAWAAILVTPCAMAFSTGHSDDQMRGLNTEQPVGIHADCPSIKTTQALPETDCCCDISDVLSSAPFELPVAAAIVLSLTGESWVHSPDLPTGSQYWLPHKSSPPVYLATQRLRI